MKMMVVISMIMISEYDASTTTVTVYRTHYHHTFLYRLLAEAKHAEQLQSQAMSQLRARLRGEVI